MTHRILVLGNSHTQALEEAVKGDTPFEIHWLKTKAEARFGTLTMDEAVDRVTSLSAEDRLVVMHLGALHNIYGLLNSKPPFTFSGLETSSEAAVNIPRATMKAMMREKICGDVVLRRIVKSAPCPVFHAMTPPPKEKLQLPEKSGKLYRGASIQELGFSPAPLRKEIWRLEQSEVAAYCDTLGVSPLAPPEQAITPDGFLKEDCYANDATHANALYGEYLRTQFAALLATS